MVSVNEYTDGQRAIQATLASGKPLVVIITKDSKEHNPLKHVLEHLDHQDHQDTKVQTPDHTNDGPGRRSPCNESSSTPSLVDILAHKTVVLHLISGSHSHSQLSAIYPSTAHVSPPSISIIHGGQMVSQIELGDSAGTGPQNNKNNRLNGISRGKTTTNTIAEFRVCLDSLVRDPSQPVGSHGSPGPESGPTPTPMLSSNEHTIYNRSAHSQESSPNTGTVSADTLSPLTASDPVSSSRSSHNLPTPQTPTSSTMGSHRRSASESHAGSLASVSTTTTTRRFSSSGPNGPNNSSARRGSVDVYQSQYRKQRLEDSAERQRVLRLVEKDKAERRARRASEGLVHHSDSASCDPYSSRNDTGAIPDFSKTTIIVRQLDGAPLKHQFSTRDSLEDVRTWIETHCTDPATRSSAYVFLQSIPRKTFDPAGDEHMSLRELGLCPSATLVLRVPSGSVSSAYPSLSFSSSPFSLSSGSRPGYAGFGPTGLQIPASWSPFSLLSRGAHTLSNTISSVFPTLAPKELDDSSSSSSSSSSSPHSSHPHCPRMSSTNGHSLSSSVARPSPPPN